MAYFLVLADDRADALDERLARRGEHIAYWNDKAGVVKVAGAMLDGDCPCGSAFLIEAEDEATARGFLQGDPFVRHGIFSGEPRIIAMRPAIGEWLPTA